MEVKIITERWEVKEVEGVKKITGKYKIMSGATEIAKQEFNDGYGATTIIFPIDLILDLEKIGKRIEDCITKNFTGGE